MNTLILRIAIITSFATIAPFALAQAPAFPAEGRSYDITWAQEGRLSDGRIRVITKTDSPWIFVEYTYKSIKRVATPDSDSVHQTVPNPERTTITKRLWVNTNWIATASELEPEK